MRQTYEIEKLLPEVKVHRKMRRKIPKRTRHPSPLEKGEGQLGDSRIHGPK